MIFPSQYENKAAAIAGHENMWVTSLQSPLDPWNIRPNSGSFPRTCIKFCVKNEIKCADAFRMLTVAYGEATLDRSNVYRWYKMFSEGREDVNDEELPDARALQQQAKKLMKWRK
ncbi:hypothetical protein LAZ67_17001105 [Cordylochernes scorpioides]|uniref:Mos1 transposase HTH domain-containing protein n=1 Tax=Cordylochernes scorpioides TaxID=51811 RepID=A0ABY6LGT2_9ARAC|nr:hypothetical protein LAZ67_17001105 [Cordylochernes scorpioides]